MWDVLRHCAAEWGDSVELGGTGAGNSAERAAHVAQVELQGDLAALRDALARLPNDVDYDEWVKIGIAIKAAGGEHGEAEAYGLWQEWSATNPKSDLAQTQARWASFRGPYLVGANYIFERARKHGFNDAALVFSKVAAGSGERGLEGGTELSAAGGLDEAGVTSRERMFRDYVYIKDVEMFANVHTRELRSHTQFGADNSRVGPPKSSTKGAAAQYLESWSRQTMIDRITYRPGEGVYLREDGKSAFNTWQPSLAVLPDAVSDSDAAPYLEHAAYLLPKSGEPDIWLDWAAAVLQQPGRKINWGPVLLGPAGNGKDLLAKPLVCGLGHHNTSIVTASTLTSAFNAWAARCVLAVVPEMHTFSRIETMDGLKPYLAAPPEHLRINEKFVREYHIPNIIHMLFFTNRDDALALEVDDRRFTVFSAEVPPRDRAYYKKFAGWLRREGGSEIVVRWLLQRSLADFEWEGRAPATEGKEDMRRLTLTGLDAWIADGIDAKAGIFASDVVALEMVDREMPASLLGRGRPSRAKIASALRRAGASKLDRIRVPESVCPSWSRVILYSVRGKEIINRLDPKELLDLFLKSVAASTGFRKNA